MTVGKSESDEHSTPGSGHQLVCSSLQLRELSGGITRLTDRAKLGTTGVDSAHAGVALFVELDADSSISREKTTGAKALSLSDRASHTQKLPPLR